jgi:UDP-N-acetylglucosamine 2-epimerase (non-hydrolysing)
MLDQVLQLFDLRPDHDLDLMRADQTMEDLVAGVLPGVAAIVARERPDLVIVQGDTASAMAASLAAYFHRVPVAHVEAGLRTGKRTSPFPEEMMRRIVGQIAELHFAPTTRAAENLRREHADAEGAIFLTGNTVVDAVKWISARSSSAPSLIPRRASRLVLLTAHRRENFGDPIRQICRAVRTLVDRHSEIEVVYPVHLNPNIQQPVREMLSGHERIHLIPPMDYEGLIQTLKDSYFVMTDSGGLQEEAPVLGKPVLVLRRDTERPEAIEAGTARLVGTDATAIISAAERLIVDEQEYRRMAQAKSPFGDGLAAKRIADIVDAWRRKDFSSVDLWRWQGVGELAPYPTPALARG